MNDRVRVGNNGSKSELIQNRERVKRDMERQGERRCKVIHLNETCSEIRLTEWRNSEGTRSLSEGT